MSKYEPLRRKPGTLSGTLPTTALVIGTALMISGRDENGNVFALADGRCDGFVDREVRVVTGKDTNPRTSDEKLYGFGIESPYVGGKQGSLERNESIEVEGADYIVKSGTGAIGSGTALQTPLSFAGGKFRVAQPNDYAQYRLVAKPTPETDGDLRIVAEEIPGYKVA